MMNLAPRPEAENRRGDGAASPRRWTVGTLSYSALGLFVLFCWLLWGDFSWSMKERAVPPITQLLLKGHGAPDSLIGFLIGSVPAILTIAIGPVISYRSDRHRGRWGRRIPYLLITTPIAVVSMAGLAFTPHLTELLHRSLGAASPGLHSLSIILYGVFWTVFEFASIIGNAVFLALINDVVPERFLGRFFGAFRAIGLMAGILFSFWIMGIAETHPAWIFLGMGALYGVAFGLMCLKVREGEYPLPPDETGGAGGGFVASARTYFRECYGHSYYRWFFLSLAFSWMAFVPVNLFSLFFARSIGMSIDTWGKCMAAAYCVSLILAYPLGVLVDRFHPLRVSLITQAVYVGVVLWGGLFVRDAATFGVVLVLQCTLAGTWMTAAASLPQRLLPKDRFAQFASAAAIVTSLGTILAGPLMGLLLDLTGQVYQYTFLVSSALAAAALVTGLVVLVKFGRLGGSAAYVAPQ